MTFYSQILRHVFNEFNGNSFKSIHLQHKFEGNEQTYCNAFITIKDVNYFIVYSQRDKIWQKILLQNNVIPHQLTIRNNFELFISDKKNNLWNGNLSNINYNLSGKNYFIELIYLGQLLGKSTSLIASTVNDEYGLNDYLYYFMPRDGAIVRWNFR